MICQKSGLVCELSVQPCEQRNISKSMVDAFTETAGSRINHVIPRSSAFPRPPPLLPRGPTPVSFVDSQFFQPASASSPGKSLGFSRSHVPPFVDPSAYGQSQDASTNSPSLRGNMRYQDANFLTFPGNQRGSHSLNSVPPPANTFAVSAPPDQRVSDFPQGEFPIGSILNTTLVGSYSSVVPPPAASPWRSGRPELRRNHLSASPSSSGQGRDSPSPSDYSSSHAWRPPVFFPQTRQWTLRGVTPPQPLSHASTDPTTCLRFLPRFIPSVPVDFGPVPSVRPSTVVSNQQSTPVEQTREVIFQDVKLPPAIVPTTMARPLPLGMQTFPAPHRLPSFPTSSGAYTSFSSQLGFPSPFPFSGPSVPPAFRPHFLPLSPQVQTAPGRRQAPQGPGQAEPKKSEPASSLPSRNTEGQSSQPADCEELPMSTGERATSFLRAGSDSGSAEVPGSSFQREEGASGTSSSTEEGGDEAKEEEKKGPDSSSQNPPPEGQAVSCRSVEDSGGTDNGVVSFVEEHNTSPSHNWQRPSPLPSQETSQDPSEASSSVPSCAAVFQSTGESFFKEKNTEASPQIPPRLEKEPTESESLATPAAATEGGGKGREADSVQTVTPQAKTLPSEPMAQRGRTITSEAAVLSSCARRPSSDISQQLKGEDKPPSSTDTISENTPVSSAHHKYSDQSHADNLKQEHGRPLDRSEVQTRKTEDGRAAPDSGAGSSLIQEEDPRDGEAKLIRMTQIPLTRGRDRSASPSLSGSAPDPALQMREYCDPVAVYENSCPSSPPDFEAYGASHAWPLLSSPDNQASEPPSSAFVPSHPYHASPFRAPSSINQLYGNDSTGGHPVSPLLQSASVGKGPRIPTAAEGDVYGFSDSAGDPCPRPLSPYEHLYWAGVTEGLSDAWRSSATAEVDLSSAYPPRGAPGGQICPPSSGFPYSQQDSYVETFPQSRSRINEVVRLGPGEAFWGPELQVPHYVESAGKSPSHRQLLSKTNTRVPLHYVGSVPPKRECGSFTDGLPSRPPSAPPRERGDATGSSREFPWQPVPPAEARVCPRAATAVEEPAETLAASTDNARILSGPDETHGPRRSDCVNCGTPNLDPGEHAVERDHPRANSSPSVCQLKTPPTRGLWGEPRPSVDGCPRPCGCPDVCSASNSSDRAVLNHRPFARQESEEYVSSIPNDGRREASGADGEGGSPHPCSLKHWSSFGRFQPIPLVRCHSPQDRYHVAKLGVCGYPVYPSEEDLGEIYDNACADTPLAGDANGADCSDRSFRTDTVPLFSGRSAARSATDISFPGEGTRPSESSRRTSPRHAGTPTSSSRGSGSHTSREDGTVGRRLKPPVPYIPIRGSKVGQAKKTSLERPALSSLAARNRRLENQVTKNISCTGCCRSSPSVRCRHSSATYVYNERYLCVEYEKVVVLRQAHDHGRVALVRRAHCSQSFSKVQKHRLPARIRSVCS
ncbi:putative proteophosphoglycan 5, related protein [Toxoplasma gondii p89]|uniref:Putative proteophosphoglycan 5, related protein n=1 Tax=Toxoplasma gondii p89 TaxID=943119 RepID=A0A086JFR5_TOXGO|nr:putative proteophosphoglycan 5, related protein [Toxoplasma gondii p89]